MDFSIDMSLFITLLGVTIVIPTCLLYLGGDNVLIKIQSGLISELEKVYSSLLQKAQRYTHERLLKGKKLKIKRALGKCPSKYKVPKLIMLTSGLSAFSLCFSIFLAFASYRYTVLNDFEWVNAALTVGLFTFVDMSVALWLAYRVPITVPVIYLLVLVIYWIVTMIIGIVLAFNNCIVFEMDVDTIVSLYHYLVLIPLCPLIPAVVSIIMVLVNELRNYHNLKVAVQNFETGKK